MSDNERLINQFNSQMLSKQNEAAPEPQAWEQSFNVNRPAAELDQAERDRLIGHFETAQDDSWGAWAGDVGVGITQGGTYNWIDEILGLAGASEQDAKNRYQLALDRNPWSTLGGEFAGGAATDIGVGLGVGATVGSVVPGAGTLAGGAVGTAAGAGKAAVRGARLLDKARRLSARTATFAGIGAAHGALAGAGAADQYGQTRGEGALSGAKYGAAFGGAIPVGGAALRTVGKGVKLGGAKVLKLSANSTPVKASLASTYSDDLMTLIKNPGASGASVGANFTDLVRSVDKLAEQSVKQGYDQLRKAGIQVDVGGLRKEFGMMAKRYDELGRPEVGSAIRKSLGTKDNVSFGDALLLRQNLRSLQRSGGLDYDDYGRLYGRLTSQVGAGAARKGVKEYWEDTQKMYNDTKELTKSQLFKKGMSDDGVREGDITSILNSQNPITGLRNQQRLLDDLAKYDKDGANAIKDEIQSFAVGQLMENDGRLLLKIANRPDADEVFKLVAKGDPGIVSALKDLARVSTGKDTSPQGVGDDVVRKVTRAGLRGGAISGAFGFSPLGLIAAAATEIGGPLVVKQALKSPKIRSFIKAVADGKVKSPTEAQRMKTLMISELAALGIILPASPLVLGE